MGMRLDSVHIEIKDKLSSVLVTLLFNRNHYLKTLQPNSQRFDYYYYVKMLNSNCCLNVLIQYI